MSTYHFSCDVIKLKRTIQHNQQPSCNIHSAQLGCWTTNPIKDTINDPHPNSVMHNLQFRTHCYWQHRQQPIVVAKLDSLLPNA